MTLAAGSRLGPYEILSALGAGGMGEVYRARDATLHRDVALKVLPELFALDGDRLARFKREAQVLASLNHPNIAAIYGFEESTHVRALVMELVEGEDLSAQIARGAMPMAEVLPIARQIAEALEAAHEQGIIHRDLKPANIKVRPDGAVKVLDFGLAKALTPDTASATAGDGTASPTMTSPAMTQMGMILGTPAYMSPEQAKGRQADKRSDVWAFGAVCYEMLSGQRAFKGDDVADTMAAVLRQDVDWTAFPTSTPSSVRRLLMRCLDRDVRQRLRDIGEARIVLADPAATTRAEERSVAITAPLQPLWRRAIPVALAVIAAGVLTGTVTWRLKPSPPLAVRRLAFTLPEEQGFSLTASKGRLIDLSPDGEQMVYVGEPSGLYLRSMARDEVTLIKGTEGHTAVRDPAFSPDGLFVAFYSPADQGLMKMAVSGGVAVPICPADAPFGISWEPGGTILFGQGRKGIMRVSENGGVPDPLVRVKDGEFAHGPHLLPDGQHVLFTIASGVSRDRWDQARIVVHSLTSGEEKTVIEVGSDARYLPSGHLVYALGGVLYARAFDARRLEPAGAKVQMQVGVRRPPAGETGVAQFSVSNSTLIYLPGPALASSALVEVALIDRDGKPERLQLLPGRYLEPRASPDGTHIAFGTDDGKDANLYTYDLSGATGTQRQSLARGRFPIWTSDSKSVAFQSDLGGDLGISLEPFGGGEPVRLTKAEQGESHAPESWSPRGDFLLYSVTKGADVSLWTLPVRDGKPDGKPTPFGDVRSSRPIGAVFSPDGQRVAYVKTEGTRTTIYVRPFPGGPEATLVARMPDNPHAVVWSVDGKELFYNPDVGRFEAVSVTTEPPFVFGDPVKLPKSFQLGPSSARRSYDIVRKGRFAERFVGLIPVAPVESNTPIASQVQVVLNWLEELKQRVPVK